MANRLYFALELPAFCRAALAEADPKITRVRWAHPEQMHLTLSFLGNVESREEDALREAVSTIRVPPFFLPLRGVGTFGGDHPSVVWAGVGKGHPHLFALHKRVQDAVLAAGLEPDLRVFHPHVTLARLRDVSGASLRPFLRKYAEHDFGMFEVKEFVLFSSVSEAPGSTNSTYTAELRQGLAQPTSPQ